MGETLVICLPPWFAISNSALKSNNQKKILTFIEILSYIILLNMIVVVHLNVQQFLLLSSRFVHHVV